MSTLRALGILEDGSDRAPQIPPSARTPLRMTQGAQTVLELSVVRPTGEALDLTAQTNLVLSLGARATNVGLPGVPPALTVTGALATQDGAGRADFTFASADTSLMTPGVYAYDLWLSSDELGRVPLIPTSPLYIEPAVVMP